MGLSRTIRIAAAAVSISLVAGPAAIAAPPPSAAHLKSAPPASADLAARLAAQRQVLTQQTAQRHQAQLQAIKAALVSGVQPLGALRPGVRSLAPGIAPMGTVVAKSLTFAPPITIQQLSVTEGDPGTPVLLTGAGFGDAGGEVHFIVASGKDLKAPFTYWSNGQIVTEVPYLDGVNAFDGYVYVVKQDLTKAPVIPFKFRPPLDVAVLGMPDCVTPGPDQYHCIQFKGGTTISTKADSASWNDRVFHETLLASFFGDDEIYKTSLLKNGWITSGCDIKIFAATYRGSASVTDCHAGTSSPYVKVHWTIDWATGGDWSLANYAPLVTITGPKGLPYF